MAVEAVNGPATCGTMICEVNRFPTPSALVAIANTNRDVNVRVARILLAVPVNFNFFLQPHVDKVWIISEFVKPSRRRLMAIV